MAKFIEWIEPYDDNVPVICRMALKHVLMVQIKKNPLYGSFPYKAIEDFLVVNWGWVKEYE